jgi:elongation factor 1 alpha-like protein
LPGQGNPDARGPSLSKDQDCAPEEDLTAENQVYTLHRAAQPSSFASTLFGTSSNATVRRAEAYPFPYTASPSYSAKPFLDPSPDDIVLAAQAKGSRFSGKK